ncbi:MULTISPECIES: alpha/beta hydrolase [unclassified Microbacterium]|uniref:alpha/beta hydrolase n=1 Tax=unclassified Microbacterium TaxID=2609290 RepID=UPI00214C5A3E|nr:MULTISPECIES: alpha/beta hydrolase [unclassified Microbacterium]MCR2810806.1 alpha/beta hydrolase [Microbacterium sp. zg.B185]WIM19786.1 alpha/beta hydrolase [Microbacterium sp. zg-B185]
MAREWDADVLGEPFRQLTLDLGEDDEGPVVATLVRALARRPVLGGILGDRRPLHDVDVLYVHGWSDYFFQRSLAAYWTDRGADFYALDLRKYGRSIRPDQTPGYITDLATYDEDIAAALAAMGRALDALASPRRLVLVGHSTGGLTLSLWAARHPGVASALLLNSPWLEFQLSAMTRVAVAPMIGLHARLRPLEPLPQVDTGFYSRAQREVREAPLEINPAWRPEVSMTVHAPWLHAILAGHAQVAAGLDIDVPVCVLLSARSVTPTRWSEELTRADTVLVVDEIARAALHLGASVTVERIRGALHDVFLSRAEARDEAYERLDRWVMGCLGTRRLPLSPGAYV